MLDKKTKQLVSHNTSIQKQFPSNTEPFIRNQAFTELLSFNIYYVVIENRYLPDDQHTVH